MGVHGSLRQLSISPSHSEEVRLRKAVLTQSASTMALLSLACVGTHAALGRWLSAAFRFVYQLVSATSFYLMRTRLRTGGSG
jgi:hypothetical protein